MAAVNERTARPVDEGAARQADAWVASTSPLTVTLAGAATACPADKLASATVSIGDHVQVTLRNPSTPLIQGVVA